MSTDFTRKVHETMGANPGMSYADAARIARNGTGTAQVNTQATAAPTPTTPPTQAIPTQTPAQNTPTAQMHNAPTQAVPAAPEQTPAPIAPNTGNFTGQVQAHMQANPGMSYVDAARAVRSAGMPNTGTQNAGAVSAVHGQNTTALVPTANREMEIMKNLNEGFTYNPALFESRENFDRAYNYASKPENERAILDSFWNSKKGDVGSFFDTLVSGGRVNDSGLEASIASMRYSAAKMYAGMNPSVLVKEIANGNLLEGSEEWDDLARINPKLAEDVLTLARINGVTPKIVTRNSDGTLSNTLELKSHEKMLDRFAGLLERANAEDIMREIMTPEFTRYQAKKEALMEEIINLSDDIEKIDRDIDKDLAGSGASGSRKRLEAIQRRRELGDDLNSKTKRLSVYQNEQDAIWNRGLIAYDRAEQINGALRNAGLNMYQSVFNENLRVQAAWNDFEQKLAQDARIQNDPRLATQAMIDSYRKQGVHAMRSDAEIIADIENQVANGRSLGEALTELNKAFQSKDEYKTLQRLHNGQMSELQKMQLGQQYNERNMALSHGYSMASMRESNRMNIENTLMQYDMNSKAGQEKAMQDLVLSGQMSAAEAKATMRNINGDWDGAQGAELLFAEDGTFIKSTMFNEKNGSNKLGGIECAEYITRMTGTRVGHTWAEKQALNTEKEGGIGKIIVWQPVKTGELAKWGHAGIIIGEDGDNWIVKNANYKVDGRISTVKVPKKTPEARYRSTNLMSQIGMSAGMNGGAVGNAIGATGSTIDPRITPYLEAINSGMMTLDSAMKEFGTSKEGIEMKNALMTAYSAQGGRQFNPNTDAEYLGIGQTIENFKTLRDHSMFNASVGPGGLGLFNRTSINPWNWGKKDQFLALSQSILDDAMLQKVSESKEKGVTFGSLTDSEWNILRNATSTLHGLAIRDSKTGAVKGFRSDEALVRAEIDKIIAHLEIRQQRVAARGIYDNNPMLQSVGNTFSGLSGVVTSSGKYVEDYFR